MFGASSMPTNSQTPLLIVGMGCGGRDIPTMASSPESTPQSTGPRARPKPKKHQKLKMDASQSPASSPLCLPSSVPHVNRRRRRQPSDVTVLATPALISSDVFPWDMRITPPRLQQGRVGTTAAGLLGRHIADKEKRRHAHASLLAGLGACTIAQAVAHSVSPGRTTSPFSSARSTSSKSLLDVPVEMHAALNPSTRPSSPLSDNKWRDSRRSSTRIDHQSGAL